MLDCLITGGTIVDGTGSPAIRADLGIVGNRITMVGQLSERARQTVDARGLVVAPGFVDIHTHYDAQLAWDPAGTPSIFHGVTTVIGGNCGFTVAPLRPSEADYLMRMMARVEGVPLEALANGLDWDWTSFAEWLDRFEGRIALNAGFLVGHSAIRRVVMGERANTSAATDDDLRQLGQTLHQSLEAGGPWPIDVAGSDPQRRRRDPCPSGDGRIAGRS